ESARLAAGVLRPTAAALRSPQSDQRGDRPRLPGNARARPQRPHPPHPGGRVNDKRIVIEIDARGEVRVQPRGYKGIGCHEATADLEAALGEVISSDPSDEAFEVEVSTELKLGVG